MSNDSPDLLSINWNDLKYFIALKRYGRLSSAAQKLNCSHVTIANRIEQLEKSIGTKLFYQNNLGFHLTKAGENLLPYAEKCESTLLLANEKYRNELKTRSTIRIGVTEGFSNYYLASRLPIWLQEQEIDVELISLASNTFITSGKVDISITVGAQNGANIIQKKLADYTLGVFASKDYIANHPVINSKTDFKQHPFIGYIEEQVFTKQLKYQKEISTTANFVYKSTTIGTQSQAIKSGLGLGILPHFVAYDESQLTQILPDLVLSRELWISTSKDLHQFKDLKLTWDFILNSCQSDKHIFNCLN